MKKRIQDMDVRGKRVLLRCDFNVPVKDGVILDDSKIQKRFYEFLMKKGISVEIESNGVLE